MGVKELGGRRKGREGVRCRGSVRAIYSVGWGWCMVLVDSLGSRGLCRVDGIDLGGVEYSAYKKYTFMF